MEIYGCGSIKKNNVYEEVLGILHAENKRAIEFSGIMSNHTYVKVQEGAELAKREQVDWILN